MASNKTVGGRPAPPPPNRLKRELKTLTRDLPAKSPAPAPKSSPIQPEEYEVLKPTGCLESRTAPCMSVSHAIAVKIRGISLTVYVAVSPWGVKDALDAGLMMTDIETAIRDLTERLEVV